MNHNNENDVTPVSQNNNHKIIYIFNIKKILLKFKCKIVKIVKIIKKSNIGLFTGSHKLQISTMPTPTTNSLHK